MTTPTLSPKDVAELREAVDAATEGHDSLGPVGMVIHITPAGKIKLAAALALASQSLEREGDGWQPIEAAPKGNCRILLFNELWGDTFGDVQIGYEQQGKWLFDGEMNINDVEDEDLGDGEVLTEQDYQPTHWRPLPESPGTKAAGLPDDQGLREGEIRMAAIEECAKKIAGWAAGIELGCMNGNENDARLLRRVAEYARAIAQQPPAGEKE